MSDPTTPPPATPSNADAAAAATPPPKKRRRWPIILMGLVILLIVFVLLLPTIISLPPVRSLVLSQASGYINGRIEVDSWSFGWFSGTKIDGVKIYDKSSVLVAEADHIDTGLTLLNLIRQNFDLGHTVIDVNATKLVVNKNGSINYLDLIPPAKPGEHAETKPKSEKSAGPVNVPNVKGDIELHLRGSVQLVDDAGKAIDLQLRQGSGGTIKIADINQGIAPDLKLIYDVNGKSPSEIDIAGDLDAIQNNKLDLAQLTSKLKLALKDVDLSAAQPVLAMAGQTGTMVSGLANGQIDTDLQPGQSGGVNGEIVITNFAFAGPQIADRYTAGTIRVPIKIARTAKDGSAVDSIDIKAILPEAALVIAGEVPEIAIANLQQQKSPGASGYLSINTTADAAKITAALPKTLQLWPDAKITAGRLVNRVDLTIQPEMLVAKTQTDFSLNGTRAGQPTSIRPINLVADASLTLPQTPSKMSLVLSSDFAHFSGGGDTLAQLHGDGSADLDKLHAQLAQFFDLGGVKLAGQADFALKSTAAGNDLVVSSTASVSKLLLSLPGKPTLDVPFVKTAADAKLATEGGAPKSISIFTATILASDDAAQPLVDGAMSANGIDLKTHKVGGFNVDHFAVSDAAQFQKRFIDPFVPALQNQQFAIAKGRINVTAAGSADQAAGAYSLSQCDVSLQNVVLRNQKGQSYTFDKPLTLSMVVSAKGSPKIDQIDISKLAGDFGVATVGMPQPISVTGLSTNPVPSGQIELAGAIENIAPLLQVIQSADARLPYKGLFKFRQTLLTKADDITLKGDGTIDNFEADDATGKASFTEKQITIANDLTANPKTHHAAINNVSLEMTASQAAKVTLNGSIADWDTSRTIEGDGIVATVKYDAAKLWPIIYAKLSPDQQKSFADAKVAGAFEKKFIIKGRYPVAKTMGESIKPLEANGAIELTQFTGGGIDLQQLLVNIMLNKGVVTLAQQPAKINDGTLSLDKVQVDLTQADLRLFTPKNLQLVSKASINPALGDTLGKYVNPTFANSKKAKGLLSVTVNECRSVALSPAALQSENSGSATLTINIQDMDIANPLGSLLLGPIVDKLGSGMSSDVDTFQGELKDGKVVLSKGVVTNNLVMTLSKPVQVTDPTTGKTATVPKGMPLGFVGDTRLKDLQMNMKVSIPSLMIASIAGLEEKKVTAILPDGLTLPLKGLATAPKPDFGGVLGKIGEGLIKSKLGGDDKNGIGELLNNLGKKKKKKDSGE